MYLPLRTSLDKILVQLTLGGFPASPRKVLFWGEGAEEISSYVAGWMAGKGIDVIVLDGANRFNPYVVSSFARRALIPPERLLKRIRIARAFTCYQMATLMGERLFSFAGATHACTPRCGLPSPGRSRLPKKLFGEQVVQAGISAYRHESLLPKPWVILLGPITTFLDEDVPEGEIRPLFERSLRKLERMAMGGISFFLFQPSVLPDRNPRRAYLMRRLFRFSNLIWKICLEEQGPKLVLEK